MNLNDLIHELEKDGQHPAQVEFVNLLRECLTTELVPILKFIKDPVAYRKAFGYEDELTDCNWEAWLKGRAQLLLKERHEFLGLDNPID